MMKKVLIFSLAYYPHVGGAEVSVKELTDRLTDLEFHMVTLRFNKSELQTEQVGRVTVHRIGMGSSLISKFLFQFAAFFKALELHRKYHFDATWGLMAHGAGVPAALFKMANPNVPYILNLQEGDPLPYIEKKMLPLWPLFTRAFTKADVVQPLSHFLAGWARQRGFKGPIVILPNGVDVKNFVGDKVAHEGVVLVTTSRLVHKNAVDDVIRALPLLPQNIRFEVLGTGQDEQKLKMLAKKEGVGSRVHFAGHVDHKDMPVYLHAADIFIRPSRSEGQGASFIEAMGAGLPVIATQEGGIADFLFDAKRNPDKPTTGWAVDPDSPAQIAAQVKEILGNPEKTAEVVKNAGELARNDYSWDELAKKMRNEVFGKVFEK